MGKRESAVDGGGLRSVFQVAWVRYLLYSWFSFFTAYALYRGGIITIFWHYLKKAIG